MALATLNSIGGFSVGEMITNVIDVNANITAANLLVGSKSNLGSIANITITGGSNGYVLTTDGTGNLTFAAVNTAAIIGGATGEIQFNSNGNFAGSNALTFNSGTNALGVAGNITANNISSNSNITASGGYVNIGADVVSVAGNIANIVTGTTGNVNLGLSANNTTIGGNTGNVTARGTLFANAVSVTGNITVSNTATITKITISDVVSNRTPIAVTSNTVIDTFATTLYRSAKYTMRVNADDGYQAIEVLLIHNGINSYVTVYGSLSTTGNDIVTIGTDITSGNVRLLATSGSANTTINLLGTYVTD